MATESSFSKGWEQFVDHKWSKKISPIVPPLRGPHSDARLDNVALAFPQKALVRLVDQVFRCVHLDVRKEKSVCPQSK